MDTVFQIPAVGRGFSGEFPGNLQHSILCEGEQKIFHSDGIGGDGLGNVLGHSFCGNIHGAGNIVGQTRKGGSQFSSSDSLLVTCGVVASYDPLNPILRSIPLDGQTAVATLGDGHILGKNGFLHGVFHLGFTKKGIAVFPG